MRKLIPDDEEYIMVASSEDLEAAMLDGRIPKTELERWAGRKISTLNEKVDHYKLELGIAQQALDAYEEALRRLHEKATAAVEFADDIDPGDILEITNQLLGEKNT
jgi:hypothetical protein